MSQPPLCRRNESFEVSLLDFQGREGICQPQQLGPDFGDTGLGGGEGVGGHERMDSMGKRQPTAIQKLGYFSPQLIGFSTVAAGSSIAVLAQGCAAVFVPVIIVVVLTGLFSVGSTVVKMTGVADDGWPEMGQGSCKRCAALESDRDELRRALVELQP